MADLGAVAEDVQGVLTPQYLLDQVGDDVAHGQLDIAARHLDVTESARLPDADAVEGSDNGVGESVLLPGRAGEVLDGQLLKAIGGERRGDPALLSLDRRPRARWNSKTIEELM